MAISIKASNFHCSNHKNNFHIKLFDISSSRLTQKYLLTWLIGSYRSVINFITGTYFVLCRNNVITKASFFRIMHLHFKIACMMFVKSFENFKITQGLAAQSVACCYLGYLGHLLWSKYYFTMFGKKSKWMIHYHVIHYNIDES